MRDRWLVEPVNLAVVIPTYNEQESIGAVLGQLKTAYQGIAILVVDDNSPDKTAAIVRDYSERFSNIKLLSRAHKQGLGSAYREGIALALTSWSPERLILMDGDGSHAVRFLQGLSCASPDLAIGSRYITGGQIQGWAWWRRVLSRCGNLYAHALLGIHVQDVTSGFMCISANLLRQLDLNTCAASGYAFLMEVKVNAANRGARVVEVPITFFERHGGVSKISWQIVVEGALTPWRLRFGRARNSG